MWVQSLGREDPLKEGKATHSSILAWRISWTEEAGGLLSIGRKEWDMTEAIQHSPTGAFLWEVTVFFTQPAVNDWQDGYKRQNSLPKGVHPCRGLPSCTLHSLLYSSLLPPPPDTSCLSSRSLVNHVFLNSNLRLCFRDPSPSDSQPERLTWS